MSAITLCTDFEVVGKSLADVRRQYARSVEDLPFLEAQRWNRARDAYNCYRYAINIKRVWLGATQSLLPGHLDLLKHLIGQGERKAERLAEYYKRMADLPYDENFQSYVGTIVENIKSDGLQPMGLNFSLRAGGFPMTLFLSSLKDAAINDFHWYTLRRDSSGQAVWTCKHPDIKVQVFDDEAGVINDAQTKKYLHFAGYFFRPDNLDY